MDARLQAKLLRAIQEREIDRVGGAKPVKVDIRILATSNRDLTQAVKDGAFREDLLYRLNVVNLRLPPLRERPGDVITLCEHFVKKYSAANGVAEKPISAEAKRRLIAHRWPGNVRELENAMERGVVLATSQTITPDLLPTQLTGKTYTASLLDHEPNASLFDLMEEIERRIIADRLERCHWNQTEAAEHFKIPLSTLNQKIKRLNIEVRKRARDS